MGPTLTDGSLCGDVMLPALRLGAEAQPYISTWISFTRLASWGVPWSESATCMGRCALEDTETVSRFCYSTIILVLGSLENLCVLAQSELVPFSLQPLPCCSTTAALPLLPLPPPSPCSSLPPAQVPLPHPGPALSVAEPHGEPRKPTGWVPGSFFQLRIH